jgi:hypothetical protein
MLHETRNFVTSFLYFYVFGGEKAASKRLRCKLDAKPQYGWGKDFLDE